MARSLLVSLAVGAAVGEATATCAHPHHDCSKAGGECCDSGYTCYRKDEHWASCKESCQPGIHMHDPPEHRTPWACTLVSPAAKAAERRATCAHPHTDCSKLGGRCCNSDEKCYRKDRHWASCKRSCEPGIHMADPPEHRSPWACTLVSDDGSRSASRGKVVDGVHEHPSEGWHGGMQATHFWDCEAGVCESSIMRPFTRRKAVYAPANAPVDPAKHGGALYGEKLWMTGAASDALSRFMGPNLYGHDIYDGNVGACGQCILVRNPHSDHPDWTAVVMKKVRCHPDNPKCSGSQRTMDFAVPSFDHLQYSLANRCGKDWSAPTFLSRELSGTCGAVPPKHCHCEKIPATSPELRMMREGCQLFREWGWHSGVPTGLSYKKVKCPPKMEERYKGPGGFNEHGVISAWEEPPPAVTTDAGPNAPSAQADAELAEPSPMSGQRGAAAAALLAPWLTGLAAAASACAALLLLLALHRYARRAAAGAPEPSESSVE